MELKKGKYIRTKNGIIDKVTIDYKGKCNNPNCNLKHVSCEYNYYDEDEIIKSSKNIIDLIEENDYINGLRVEKNKYGELYTSYVYIGGDTGTQEEVYTTFLKDYDINDIEVVVTKEQFESIKYEVK